MFHALCCDSVAPSRSMLSYPTSNPPSPISRLLSLVWLTVYRKANSFLFSPLFFNPWCLNGATVNWHCRECDYGSYCKRTVSLFTIVRECSKYKSHSCASVWHFTQHVQQDRVSRYGHTVRTGNKEKEMCHLRESPADFMIKLSRARRVKLEARVASRGVCVCLLCCCSAKLCLAKLAHRWILDGTMCIFPSRRPSKSGNSQGPPVKAEGFFFPPFVLYCYYFFVSHVGFSFGMPSITKVTK